MDVVVIEHSWADRHPRATARSAKVPVRTDHHWHQAADPLRILVPRQWYVQTVPATFTTQP
jgi:hypothetical protein